MLGWGRKILAQIRKENLVIILLFKDYSLSIASIVYMAVSPLTKDPLKILGRHV
jgi:hypothetical protein